MSVRRSVRASSSSCGSSPDFAVDEKDDGVGALDRGARLGLDRRPEAGFGVRVEPGGVDEQHAAAVHLDLFGDAIARDARLVEGERAALPGEAVEQRRLPDVRASDDRDDRDLRLEDHGMGRRFGDSGGGRSGVWEVDKIPIGTASGQSQRGFA